MSKLRWRIAQWVVNRFAVEAGLEDEAPRALRYMFSKSLLDRGVLGEGTHIRPARRKRSISATLFP